jgi:hypothetical protein
MYAYTFLDIHRNILLHGMLRHSLLRDVNCLLLHVLGLFTISVGASKVTACVQSDVFAHHVRWFDLSWKTLVSKTWADAGEKKHWRADTLPWNVPSSLSLPVIAFSLDIFAVSEIVGCFAVAESGAWWESANGLSLSVCSFIELKKSCVLPWQ